MSEKDDTSLVREAIFEGLDRDASDISTVLSAFKQTPINYMELLREETAFLRELITTETPSDLGEIKDLSKEEVIFATYRANFFEKLRIPALDDAQLEHLLMRTRELWGESPTEPQGRWVDWCLWTHLQRRRNGVPITEVVAGDKTAEDLKQSWIDRHKEREEKRRLNKVDQYDRYETPEDVPKSIQRVLMSPFIQEEVIQEDVESDPSNQEGTENQ